MPPSVKYNTVNVFDRIITVCEEAIKKTKKHFCWDGTCGFYVLTRSDNVICCLNNLRSRLHNLLSCSNNIIVTMT